MIGAIDKSSARQQRLEAMQQHDGFLLARISPGYDGRAGIVPRVEGPVLRIDKVLEDASRALTQWKDQSAPRPVERTGIPATGV